MISNELYEEVKDNLNDNRIEENAHHNKAFVKKILRDMTRIPLWSSICYDTRRYDMRRFQKNQKFNS